MKMRHKAVGRARRVLARQLGEARELRAQLEQLGWVWHE
jgi:hypothetical protein